MMRKQEFIDKPDFANTASAYGIEIHITLRKQNLQKEIT